MRDDTHRLVVELESTASTPRSRSDEVVRDQRRLLSRIAQTGDVMAVPHLLSFLLDPETRFDAAAAISLLVENVTAKELLLLHEMRGMASLRGPWDAHTRWAIMKPNQVAELDQRAEWSVWLIGLASFHASGHVREAAVRRLGRRPEPHALPFLLLRANDWVPQVRAQARLALDRRLSEGPVAQFALALHHLLRLERGRREDHAPFVRRVFDALLNDPGLVGLEAASRAKDRYVRRAAYALLWELPDAEVPPFLDSALTDEDVPVRVAAARRALRLQSPEAWIERLRGDRSAAVRSILVDYLGNLEPAFQEALVPFLTDRSPSIRRDARFYLRRHGWTEFAPIYRDTLVESSSPRDLEAVILGLGETGTPADAARVRPFLTAERTRVRRAAVATLVRLGHGTEAGALEQALLDPAPSVSRVARQALLKTPHVLSPARLTAILTSGPPPHLRRNVLQLLLARSPWSSLPYLLELSRESEGDLREESLHTLDQWLARARRSYLRPSPDEIQHLRINLERSADALGDRHEKLLQFFSERRVF